MANLRFEKWSTAAASRIVFPPDRWEVERELNAHLQDHYQDALLQGMTEEEAEAHTLDAMGPPEAIAAELGLIHRPFWGRFHLLSKWLVTIMVCLTLFFLSAYLLKGYVLLHDFSRPVYYRYDPFEDRFGFDDGGTYRRQDYGEPYAVSLSDGYLFLLRRYALWQDSMAGGLGNPRQEEQMYLELQVISLIPWSDQTDISRWFRARDDLGNLYDPACQAGDLPTLRSSVFHTAPGVYTHILSFSEYRSQEASRLELIYDRAGRNIILGIDLTEEGKK